jgi:CRISPR-associated protein Csm1
MKGQGDCWMSRAETRWMDGSCRVAFAGLMHDLGKLAQRARIFDKDPRREINQQLYCTQRPPEEGGYFTHLHAADTALAIDELERHLPDLIKGSAVPFASLGDPHVTDSLINAAAAHHKPDTFLQWIVASADRIASGFERDTFKNYNGRKERDDYVTARMLVPFEEYKTDKCEEAHLDFRYPLGALSAEAIVPSKEKKPDAETARLEYQALWNTLIGYNGEFASGVSLIPKSHRVQWPLWLDHFDSLWLAISHAIPSASAFGSRPDISLYDHSKTVAALAVALWRYHAENNHDETEVARAQRERSDWNTDEKFLLIQGDFYGIQQFIFGATSINQKGIARTLRGRSALVSLLTELAALKILDALELPTTSQIINAAGRFLIVAPNTKQTQEHLSTARSELDRWFLERSFGLAGIAIASKGATPNDLVIPEQFKALDIALWQDLERTKRQMFDLCDAIASDPIRVVDYSMGPCQHDTRLPAEVTIEGGDKLNLLNADAIALGRALTKKQRLLIFRANGVPTVSDRLQCDFFGYCVVPSGDRDDSGNFGAFAIDGRLRRAFDISLPEIDDTILWNGYARRPLAAYVPVHQEPSSENTLYDGIEEQGEVGDLKTFEHLARDDQVRTDNKLFGVRALGVLKGDIDDLGALFSATLGRRRTFAKSAELSRRVNTYFTLRVPWICQRDFPNVYTVFAGGDDFLFVGPWRTLKRFAAALREDFVKYVAQNPEIHFSAGYAMVRPGFPVCQMVARADEALEDAKKDKKNSISLFDQRVPWSNWCEVEDNEKAISKKVTNYELSMSYIYSLLELAEMAADKSKPQNAAWRSKLFYRTSRIIREKRGRDQQNDGAAIGDLITTFGENGISKNADTFRIALIDHIYSMRD